MNDESETRPLLTPKKAKSIRRAAPSPSLVCPSGAADDRIYSACRILMDHDRTTILSPVGDKPVLPINSQIVYSAAPARSGSQSVDPRRHRASTSSYEFHSSASSSQDEDHGAQSSKRLLLPQNDGKLDAPRNTLSTSSSTPSGFLTTATATTTTQEPPDAARSKQVFSERLSNTPIATFPFISILQRSGGVSSRKLSFDSASLARRQQEKARSLHLAPAGCQEFGMSSNGDPIRWTSSNPIGTARSRTSSVVGELPTITQSGGKGHKMSAPASMAATPSPLHASIQAKTSGGGVGGGGSTSPTTEALRNPLYAVSNEYMKVSGYSTTFNKLLSVKRKKTTVTEQQRDLEKGCRNDETKNNDTNANNGVTGSPTFDANDKKAVHPRSVYGRLYKAPMNQRQMFKKRKDLFCRRVFACNIAIICAVIGLVLTILEAELSASDIISKVFSCEFLVAMLLFLISGFVSCFIRSIIVVSTIILLSAVTWYHAIEIKLSVIDSGAHDWRVALTADRVFQMLLELFLCAICPIPGNINLDWIVLLDDHRQTHTTKVPLDILLSLPMFLRMYLFGRFMALHSDQFQDAATRSIARLNRVTVNFGFVMKSLMQAHPLRVLFGFTVVFWLVISWILVQCERYDGIQEDNHYLNAIWFTIITFMSIGYGDIVPNTYCGRVVAITIGIVGAGVSSALIAVMSLKLELSRAEKHVNNFMTDTKLSKQRKDAAATVLQHTWFIHKFKSLSKTQDEIKLRFHQRRFLASINEFRRIKWEQRKLAEQGNALVDVAKLQSDMHSTLWDIQHNQNQLSAQLQTLTQRIQELYDSMIIQNAANHAAESSLQILSPSSPLLTNPQA